MDGPFLVDGRQRRVDRAVLQPLISVPEGHDPLAHHRYVAEQVAKHPDRFSGCFVANPLLDTDLTLSCLRELVGEVRVSNGQVPSDGPWVHAVPGP